MKAVLTPSALPPMSKPDRAIWPGVALAGFLALLWLEIINHLRGEWSLNPQYAYGWSVPFVALFLFWRRWMDRPPPVPPESTLWPRLLLIVSVFLFFPVRFIAEANPDWRLLSWIFAIIGVASSILVVFLEGGRPWARHFAFPILFFLIAIPWPTQFEQSVVQTLMRAVTSINVSLLNFAGIPALQHGNVIELSSGLIGIEEACSGVRSLQATLMISLFLGELYSFKVTRRILLVAAGAVLAFLCNVARTALLVSIGARHGTAAIESWHDSAGLTILFVCLFGLWLLSLAMQRRSPAPGAAPQFETRPRARRIAGAIVMPLFLFIVATEIFVQFWYRAHPTPPEFSRWNVDWPKAEAGYKSVPISHEAEALLYYNEGGGAAWVDAEGHQWLMYFFRWLPGRTAARFVKIHRPDICLPASGMTLQEDNGIEVVSVNKVSLPLRSYRFDNNGVPLSVFYCYWDARSSYESPAAAAEEDWSARGRLRAAWRGQAEQGAQMLEIAVWGFDKDADARAALKKALEQIVQPR